MKRVAPVLYRFFYVKSKIVEQQNMCSSRDPGLVTILLMAGYLVLGALCPRPGCASEAIPSVYENCTEEQLAEAIEKARRGELLMPRDRPETWNDVDTVVKRAGESGNKDFIPALEDIAQYYAGPQEPGCSHTVTLRAMHALWQLGQPLEYFMRKVQEFDMDTWAVGYYAMFMVARWPEDQRVQDFARKIYENLDNPDCLRGAANRVLYAFNMLIIMRNWKHLKRKLIFS